MQGSQPRAEEVARLWLEGLQWGSHAGAGAWWEFFEVRKMPIVVDV